MWVAEAYSFDSISLIGYLAAKTSTIQIGTGIINVYSRTASAVAQTAAGCDFVTGGRFVLGLGASGPQVIEGFHGVPYDKPMARIIDYINVCRMVLRREPVVYDGPTVHVPLPPGQGTGLGKALKIINQPVRPDVPIFWASVKGNSVAATARIADGWLPIFFDPTRFADVWGDDLQRGLAERDPQLGPLQISAGGMLAIGDEYAGSGADALLDLARPTYALYIGGMGARGQNFYTELGVALRLRAGGQGDPGPLPRRQQGRGGPARAPGDARQHQPRRLHGRGGRARRRLPRGRRHPPPGDAGDPRPGEGDRPAPRAAVAPSVECLLLTECHVSSCQHETLRDSKRSDGGRQTRPRSHHRLSAQAMARVARAPAAQIQVRSVTTSTSSPSVSPRTASIRS